MRTYAYRRLLHDPLRHASRLARASRSFGSQPFAYVVINPWDPTLGHGGALGILQEMNPLTASEIGIVALVAVRTHEASMTNFDGIDDDHFFELTGRVMAHRGLLESSAPDAPLTLSREKLRVPGTPAQVQFDNCKSKVWAPDGYFETTGPMRVQATVEALHEDDDAVDVAVSNFKSANLLDLHDAEARVRLVCDTTDELGRPGFVVRVPLARCTNHAEFLEV